MLPHSFWYHSDSMMLRRKMLCCVLSFSEYETNMKRRDGLVAQTQMGKKTVISRLFMVRGGTLKMMPSRSPQTFLNFSSLTSVRYSQMRSRCQFQTRELTGSRMRQASWTNSRSVSLRPLVFFAEADAGAASRSAMSGEAGEEFSVARNLRALPESRLFLRPFPVRRLLGLVIGFFPQRPRSTFADSRCTRPALRLHLQLRNQLQFRRRQT